ncbi:hypothetical protein Taro_043914 [Colocasia esculenta]|uniref:Bulb-type lectin domain-containing protein n=1 Tax=Colocasia esculenta TaxID=4460 RepID=A0A843X1N4_COLES|nr:hypothetical protein [Colocasia esculenta]
MGLETCGGVLGMAAIRPVWQHERTVIVLPPNVNSDRSAQLLDTSILVVREAEEDINLPGSTPFWQSFDEPEDTLLPTMKLLANSRTGASRHLTSCNSDNDPSPGSYSYTMDIHN